MKSTIRVISLFALLLFTNFPVQAKEPNKGHGVRGELTKVEENTITFIKTKKADKPSVTVTILDDAKIVINGEDAAISDLVVGMTVFVDVNETDKTAYSVEVRGKKQKKEKGEKKQKDEDKGEEAQEDEAEQDEAEQEDPE